MASRRKNLLVSWQKRRNVSAPEFVPPMRATAIAQLPEGPEWIYEVKWDGYRALAAKFGQQH